MPNWIKMSLIALLSIILLAACAEESDPAETVQEYLDARVASDAETLQSLACPEWEQQAILQADSFRSMEASLEGVSCEKLGEDGDFTIVACEGKIVTTYNGETRDWALGSYRLIDQDGEWKMCGEAE